MRSRLAEILGVEEDQVFIANGSKYRICDGHRQWHDGEKWVDTHAENGITDLINGKWNIKVLRSFTEEEVRLAKALKKLFPSAAYVHVGDRRQLAWVEWPFSPLLNHIVAINENAFPSLKEGEKVRLDEIIGSEEDA